MLLTAYYRDRFNLLQDVYAKYRLDEHSDWNQTKVVKDTKNPDWNFKQQHDFKPATAEVRIALLHGNEIDLLSLIFLHTYKIVDLCNSSS